MPFHSQCQDPARCRKASFSRIKIDRSFIMNLLTQPDDEIIVRSTIELAHNMGLVVTAEGVESEAVLQRLGALGCDLAQGYFIGRPMAAADLAGWMDDSPWACAGHHRHVADKASLLALGVRPRENAASPLDPHRLA